MKKFLSLVLALVMTMSLVTISAGATDFTDDDSITYQEAIDVISAIGVVSGYSDGSFHPTDNLTRGAAAKIITNLILGPNTASTLVCTTAPYPDVPVGHTFAAAITYCSQNKIINGYPDGSFRPDGTLTGYAFLKMLLGALGYDGTIEGFTGANWSINVAKLADGIGLTNKVADTFAGSSAVDRQTACLFAFNTIKSDLVEYDNRITANVGGVDVAIGGSNTAKSVQWPTQATRANSITNDNIVQFGERYFSRLVRNDGKYNWDATYTDLIEDNVGLDNMNRPATKWTWKGESVGTYVEDASLTFAGSKTITDIYNELKLSDSARHAYLFINGMPYNANASGVSGDNGEIEVKRSNDKKLSKYSESYLFDTDNNGDGKTARIGNGTVVEVFFNNLCNEVIISAQSVYGGKVASVKGDSAKKDAYVTIDGGDKTPMGFYDDKGEHTQFVTTEFKVDDVVAYTYSDKDAEIASMYKMESVEGSLKKYTTGKSLQLGETTYKYAQEISFGDGLSGGEGDLSNGSNYLVYQDKDGNALWVEEAEFNATAYALVLRITAQKDGKNSEVFGWGWLNAGDTYTDENGTQQTVGTGGGYYPLNDTQIGAWDGNRARLLFADGTTRTVNLDKAYLNNAENNIDPAFRAGKVVRYSALDNGTYKLASAGRSSNTLVTDAQGFDIDSKKVITVKEGGQTVNVEFDNSTVFVVNDGGSYKVYTGKRNAPQITDGEAFIYYTNDGSTKIARVVFVTDGEVVGNSKDVTFIAGESVSKLVQQSDGDNYYVYNAVVKGEITTIMVNETQDTKTIGGSSKTSEVIPGGKGNVLVNTTAYDSDDLLTFGYLSGVSKKTAEGLKKAGGNDIRVDTWNAEDRLNNARGSLLTIANGTKVFYVDDGGDIEEIEVSEITTDPNVDLVYTLDDDGDINNLFIIEVDR